MRDITINLVGDNGAVVESENFKINDNDFHRRFHEECYDRIYTASGRAENIHHLRSYQVVMEVRPTH